MVLKNIKTSRASNKKGEGQTNGQTSAWPAAPPSSSSPPPASCGPPPAGWEGSAPGWGAWPGPGWRGGRAGPWSTPSRGWPASWTRRCCAAAPTPRGARRRGAPPTWGADLRCRRLFSWSCWRCCCWRDSGVASATRNFAQQTASQYCPLLVCSCTMWLTHVSSSAVGLPPSSTAGSSGSSPGPPAGPAPPCCGRSRPLCLQPRTPSCNLAAIACCLYCCGSSARKTNISFTRRNEDWKAFWTVLTQGWLMFLKSSFFAFLFQDIQQDICVLHPINIMFSF